MAAGAPWTSSSSWRLGRGAVAALRWAGAVVLGVLAALGALTAPLASLLIGVVAAALGWAFVRALHHSPEGHLPSLPHPMSAAAWMAVLPAVAAGTAPLGLGPLGVAGVTIAVAVAVGWWGGSCGEPHPRPAGQDADPDPDERSLRELLSVVPVGLLFDEWRRIAEPALDGRGPETRFRLRCLLIAELRRRDPVGTERWLSRAPEAPPDGYVQDAPDRAT
ncbi:hypothetical protein ACI784_23300 [Geodermatophilus sp. SYSU D01186]